MSTFRFFKIKELNSPAAQALIAYTQQPHSTKEPDNNVFANFLINEQLVNPQDIHCDDDIKAIRHAFVGIEQTKTPSPRKKGFFQNLFKPLHTPEQIGFFKVNSDVLKSKAPDTLVRLDAFANNKPQVSMLIFSKKQIEHLQTLGQIEAKKIKASTRPKKKQQNARKHRPR